MHLCRLVLLLGLATGQPTIDEAVALLRADAAAQAASVPGDSVQSCVVTATESCSLSGMPEDQTTVVFPGGQTRCIYSDSTDYSFQVVPGDRSKLIFYFQGGGACWNRASTALGLCSKDASPSSLVGMFSRDPVENPEFADHTIVQVGMGRDVYTGAGGGPAVEISVCEADRRTGSARHNNLF